MFGTIRKHQTWLWAILIVLMSLGLIVFFSPDASLGGGRSRQGVDVGSINGRPIPPGEYDSARREAMIGYFLRNNNWPGNDEQSSRTIEFETLSRFFLVYKLRELGIQPSDKAVAQLMYEQIKDTPPAELENKFFKEKGLAFADYERFVRHEVGRMQLMAAAGVSGKFVRAGDAEALYRKENQESHVQLALIWASNYTDQVVITNGAIGAYYTNNPFRYRIPERTILSYVEFTATNFFADADKQLAAITNLDEQITGVYYRRNTNDPFFLDDKGNPLPEAEAKKKIRGRDREILARTAAHRAGADFGNALIEPRSTPGLDPDANKLSNFERLAATNKLVVKATKPFDALTGLEEFDAPTNSTLVSDENIRAVVRRAAADLKEATPIRFNPIVAPHAVFLIARQGTVPSEMPPLEKISGKVTNDYKTFMAQDVARKTGAAFGTNVTNGLALKKSFADICKADGVKVVDLPPFSDTTESLTNLDQRINFRMVQNMVREMEVGKATPFLPFTPDAGLVLYLKDRPKPDDAKVQAALPEYVNRLRLYRQFEAFNQWFQKQATDARLTPPKRTNETAAVPN